MSPPTPLAASLFLVLLAAAAVAVTEAHIRPYVPRLRPGVPRVSLSREFLHAHNNVRRRLGEKPLRWDSHLARYARRWAMQRFYDCRMIHSYGPYGENIFWGGRDHWTASEAVESWVHEDRFYNPATNECAVGQMCGHYTQVVWRDSRRVGCARQRCRNGGVLIFCEYDPPGNYVNENPFGSVEAIEPLSGKPVDPLPDIPYPLSNSASDP